MSFIEAVQRAGELLRQQGRISLRALELEFSLDAEQLEALVEELVDIQQVAAREGKAIAWVGAKGRAEEMAVSAEPTPGPEAERRQLTVMFCDLVGSTQLAERVDPEELGEIVREYRAVCVEATKRFDGHIAQYLGDGVMIYFGYPQAHEDDAGRAIRAGLEIQRVLGERPEPRRIDARIGVHTGLVVVDPTGGGDDALALGAAANVAARVQGLAKPGTVVASGATLALCRGAFVTRSLGERQLKGVEAPVPLHEVERSVGVRTATAADATKVMVGRDREVGLLVDRWDEVQDGRGQVVLISGEAGMGKSRLLQALRDEMAGTPHLWLDVQCSPFTSGSAFQPLVDLFHTGLRASAAESPLQASQQLVSGLESMPGLPGEKVIPYLLALLGLPAAERHPLPQTSAEEQRNRTLSALVQLLHTLSEQRPVVFAAEDLHWSDPSTLEYLARMVEQAPTSRVLMVLTFRPEFHPSWTRSHVAEVKLAPLSRRVTREMIVNAAGGHLPEPVLAELVARSDGVPLFVEELANSVVSSGLMTEQAGRYELRGGLTDLAIPATLQDSLMGRLDRLSASKKIAQQAATLGREFSYELIEAVTDLDAPSLRTALDQLGAAEIVHQRGTPPDAMYTFKHALLQDTAYESQLLSTRKALHGRIAEVLEERFPMRVDAEPETMARHCAAAGEPAKAVDHYQRAAEIAMARLANEEASEYCGRALESLAELPENDDRHQREVAILVARGKSQWTLHGFDAPEVLATFDRVEALCQAAGDGPQQLPARLGLVMFHATRGDLSANLHQGEAILRIAEQLGVPELVVTGNVLIGSALLVRSSAVEAEKRLSQALSIAEPLAFPPPDTAYDPDLIAMAHVAHAVSLATLARRGPALRSLELGLERARDINHDYSRVQLMMNWGTVGFVTDDPELARTRTEEALAIADGRGFHSLEVVARIWLGWALARGGEVREGLKHVEKGLSLADATGSVAGLPLLTVAAAHVHLIANQPERAGALLDLAASRCAQTGDRAYYPFVCSARAQILLELEDGAPAEAERLLLDAVERAGSLDNLQLELIVGTQLARLALRTGRVREAHDRLAGHYNRLTQGFDRRPTREAKAALDELAARLDAAPTAS